MYPMRTPTPYHRDAYASRARMPVKSAFVVFMILVEERGGGGEEEEEEEEEGRRRRRKRRTLSASVAFSVRA